MAIGRRGKEYNAEKALSFGEDLGEVIFYNSIY